MIIIFCCVEKCVLKKEGLGDDVHPNTKYQTNKVRKSGTGKRLSYYDNVAKGSHNS
jgi:hypothetical protein